MTGTPTLRTAPALVAMFCSALGFTALDAAQPAATSPPAAAPASGVRVSPLALMQNGRQAEGNNQIMTTGIRGLPLPSNHALIITVSGYQRSPLPGVLTDRKLGIEMAQRLGVPQQNIVELSEEQVTREGLKQALASMNQQMAPGDKLFIYFSGHGARFFSKETGQCTESIVMQNMKVVTNREFTDMIKPLSAKADKTIVMLDSCHSGGVAQAAQSRELLAGAPRPKFSKDASSPQCGLAVNLGSFATDRGIDLNTTDQNLVLIAAARKNEVAWDTSRGGALTYNFEQCLNGAAEDTDHSGSISMGELVACTQARLDKTQEESALQHVTLVGNAALVPAFNAAPAAATGAAGDTGAAAPTGTAAPTSAAAAAGPSAGATGAVASAPVDTLAALHDIYGQRDDRWAVTVTADQPTLKIGSQLGLTVRSDHAGFVYVFYRGSAPDSLYLLFPNQLDGDNAIAANQELKLPRAAWAVTALGPVGTDHVLVMVSETARDFSALSLPAEYVSQTGAFDRIHATTAAVTRIAQLATLSAAAGKSACTTAAGTRDLGVARTCSSTFGAGMVSVDEIN
ncbi:MAG TPA: caspase family protein [Steroidobacteraceae bacterium]|nr:caspase family protein [Steroidobacteraceae bacterium]